MMKGIDSMTKKAGRPRHYETDEERDQARRASVAKAQAKYSKTLKYRAGKIISLKKRHAKHKGLDFNLDVEWLLPRLEAGCELTGIPFKQAGATGRRGPDPFSLSIDRINPKAGYTKDNCRLVLWAVNRFKNDLSDSQLFNITEKLMFGLMRAGVKRRP